MDDFAKFFKIWEYSNYQIYLCKKVRSNIGDPNVINFSKKVNNTPFHSFLVIVFYFLKVNLIYFQN